MKYKEENLLFENNILSSLPTDLISNYLALDKFSIKNYNKNEIIHIENDLCKQIEIIIEGEIVVERIGESGDLMIVNIFYPQEIIGANLIFSKHHHYPFTITAKENSKVIVVDKNTILELCNQFPSFLLEFIQIISNISVLIGTRMKNRVSRTIRESIITYINKLYNLQHSYHLSLTMSKKALAERFGVSRTSLSRELQKMKNDNLISYNANTITIIDKSLIR